jgi:uroporphyrinogen decarboxylase
LWKDGTYAGGVLDSEEDLDHYSHPASFADQYFDREHIQETRDRFPYHCLFYGSHDIGPLTCSYMSMGLERFFLRLVDDRAFVHRLLANRTEWSIAMCRRAVEMGAELLVLGDDAAHSNGPMMSPQMWRQFVLPCHRQVVDAVDVPVIWHSDGDIERLLPFAIEAGFAGVHGLQPSAGVDLCRVKREYGQDLVLIGNIDIEVLFGASLQAVRAEVDRCLEQGAQGGGYMMATSNSICAGMNPPAVAEMFRYQGEVGFY